MASVNEAVSRLSHFILGHSGTLLLVSLGVLVSTLVLLPAIVARLPVDYFVRPQAGLADKSRTPLGLLLLVVRNVVGVVLATLGLLMLFTPGQGLLTLLLGLVLMNYPGKHALERSLARREGVMKGLNWVRRKSGLPPFTPPAPRSTVS